MFYDFYLGEVSSLLIGIQFWFWDRVYFLLLLTFFLFWLERFRGGVAGWGEAAGIFRTAFIVALLSLAFLIWVVIEL
jgi:hypothetical protein